MIWQRPTLAKTWLAILVAVAWCASAPPVRAAGEGVFHPETFTLDNGMQVVAISNAQIPVVTHMVWYRVGAADETAGKSGIAHFLEHLMFKGTRKHPEGEFSKLVARHGGRENAFTSSDYTGYYQTVARDRLEMVMELEADRMTGLVFSSRQVEAERQVVLEERRSRTENNPAALLREQVDAALYLNHPYNRPVIGWEHEIRALTIADIESFYRRWYAPNNAILVVAGKITAAELRPLAEKYYGGIPRGDVPPRARPEEPPPRAARTVELRDGRVRQPAWSRTYLAPSYTEGEAEHTEPLEVLADIMGGGATSRLYRTLVVEKRLAVSASAYYDPDSRGPTTFSFYASPAPGVSIETLAAALDDEIAKLVKDGVNSGEVERAKERMRASTVYALDALGTGARVLGAALASGRTVEHVETWPERVAAVTVEDVGTAARAVFAPERSVTARLLPEKGS